jgi:hypothetical protein
MKAVRLLDDVYVYLNMTHDDEIGIFSPHLCQTRRCRWCSNLDWYKIQFYLGVALLQ